MTGQNAYNETICIILAAMALLCFHPLQTLMSQRFYFPYRKGYKIFLCLILYAIVCDDNIKKKSGLGKIPFCLVSPKKDAKDHLL